LESQDIIEKVNDQTPWVSPVIVVPKPNGDIRLCVDMREANQAIIRERKCFVLSQCHETLVILLADISLVLH
jgi:hypothetical protein